MLKSLLKCMFLLRTSLAHFYVQKCYRIYMCFSFWAGGICPADFLYWTPASKTRLRP